MGDEGYTVTLRQVHEDMIARFDRIEETVTRPLAQLTVRVEHLEERDAIRETQSEKRHDRSLQRYGLWVSSVVALVVGLIDFIK